MLKFLPLFVCVSCASIQAPQPGVASSLDEDCGQVGTVDVRLRASVTSWPRLFTCAEMVRAASIAGYGGLHDPWTLILTATGGVTLEVDRQMAPRRSCGATFPSRRVIEVDVSRDYRWILTHELHHTQDVEAGRRDTLDP